MAAHRPAPNTHTFIEGFSSQPLLAGTSVDNQMVLPTLPSCEYIFG